jgi:hypothetical protein
MHNHSYNSGCICACDKIVLCFKITPNVALNEEYLSMACFKSVDHNGSIEEYYIENFWKFSAFPSNIFAEQWAVFHITGTLLHKIKLATNT